MEEEINYSTMVFKNAGPDPKEKKEDQTIYSEVKPKVPAPAVHDGEAAAHSDFLVLAVCLGILCVLLAASIGAITYISVVMTEQKANLRNLTASNQQLTMERSNLEKQTEKLSKVTGKLNSTLGFILNLNIFPVNEYCPGKKCQPCQKDWILFQEKCYLFYNKDAPWKTWAASRKHCQDTAADLVVIDSLQEQEFISNHIKFYYDKYHGYWFGLHEPDGKNWLWVDGRNKTLKYWIPETLGSPGLCALMIPGRNSTASWDPENCAMLNKFICESEALTWPN